MKHTFLAVIERGREGFGAYLPDLPGCVSAGDTILQAIHGMNEALAIHLEGMIEDGEPIPEARWDGIETDNEVDVVAVAVVEAEVSGPVKRYNVTLPEGLVRRIDAVSNNRSAFLADAARQILRRT